MAYEVRLPEISENVASGRVATLLVQEGDTVARDQDLVEMETDKAVLGIPSPRAGRVLEIAVAEGDEVKVGELLLRLEEEEAAGGGEKKDSSPAPAEPAAGEEEKEEEEEEEEGQEEQEGDGGEGVEEERPSSAGDREGVEREPAAAEEKPERARTAEEPPDRRGDPAPASPSVRRLARELGIEIDRVAGTGPRGRISREDVKEHAKDLLRQAAPAGPAGTPAAPPDLTRWGEVRREPMNPVRRITAEGMAAAWSSIPHVFQFEKADMEGLEAFRRRHGAGVEAAGGRLTPTVVVLKVLGLALQAFPRMNAAVDMARREILYRANIDVGVAVDTERGLLVPVVRGVAEKSITELAVELADLSERARNRKLKPEEMEGGTFTLSNLGAIGGDNFTPIVYPPQVGILGLSRAAVEPVWEEGRWVPRRRLPLTLSYDHRANDGADGARFLHWIVAALEQPLALFL